MAAGQGEESRVASTVVERVWENLGDAWGVATDVDTLAVDEVEGTGTGRQAARAEEEVMVAPLESAVAAAPLDPEGRTEARLGMATSAKESAAMEEEAAAPEDSQAVASVGSATGAAAATVELATLEVAASGEVRSEAVSLALAFAATGVSGVVQEEIQVEAWAGLVRVVAVENAVLATLVVEALGVVWQDQGNVEMAPAVSEEEEVERLESQVAALVELGRAVGEAAAGGAT